jgi:hypothetical protein
MATFVSCSPEFTWELDHAILLHSDPNVLPVLASQVIPSGDVYIWGDNPGIIYPATNLFPAHTTDATELLLTEAAVQLIPSAEYSIGVVVAVEVVVPVAITHL